MGYSRLFDTDVVAVAPSGRYRIWVRFADDTEGDLDLAAELENEDWEGLLEPWSEPGFFESVRLHNGGIAWGEGDRLIEFGADGLYCDVTGLSDRDLYPALHATRVVQAKALEGHRVWVRFADGAEGEADLSHLVGKEAFRQWQIPGFLEDIRVEYNTVAWGSEDSDGFLDLCPQALYTRVTGVTWDHLWSTDFALQAAASLQTPERREYEVAGH